MSLFLIFCIYLIPPLIAFMSIMTVEVKGTDQYYHRLLVTSIKKNNNRFISTIPYIIGENRMAYPQLLHWFLSYFEEARLNKIVSYISVSMHFLSSIALFLMGIYAYQYISRIGSPIELDQLLLLTGIIYSSSPYHYDMINAKNMGISARGLGLVLGQCLLYAFFLYHISASMNYLYVGIIIALLLFLSSTFGAQFLLFSSIIYCLISLDFNFLIPILGGLLLLLLIFPKMSIIYLKGQLAHKFLYAKYSAPRNLLKKRYSIWRDFVYDFWKLLFNSPEIPLKQKVKYIATNSVVQLMFTMPTLLLIAYLWYNNYQLLTYQNPFQIISIPIVVCLLTFIVTSFRTTRFLGEPERYLEFALGIVAFIIAVYYRDHAAILFGVIFLSLLFIFFRILLYQKYLKRDVNLKFRNQFEATKLKLEEYIESQGIVKPALLCQNTQMAKMFLGDKFRVFWHPSFQMKIEGFHYKDLFISSYDYIKLDMIQRIVESSRVNIIILDKKYIPPKFDKKLSDRFNLIIEIGSSICFSYDT